MYEIGNYRLEPCGTAWSIRKLGADRDGNPKWKAVEYYPLTFAEGMRKIFEWMMQDGEDCSGFAAIAEALERVSRQIAAMDARIEG